MLEEQHAREASAVETPEERYDRLVGERLGGLSSQDTS